MSNALQRDLAKLVAAGCGRLPSAAMAPYAQHFHIMPPAGWLNDPNGLCQAGGCSSRLFSVCAV